jgi:hypothetical protein
MQRQKYPIGVRRRLRVAAKEPAVPPNRVMDVTNIIGAVCSIGILAVAIYAAFFSPFSESVELQLRSELAVNNQERLGLAEDIQDLELQKRSLEAQIQDLKGQLTLTSEETEKRAKQLGELNIEILSAEQTLDELGRELTTMHQDKFITALPFHWARQTMPEVYVVLLNSMLGEGQSIGEDRFNRTFADFTDALDAIEARSADQYSRAAASILRKTFQRNCPNKEVYQERLNKIYNEEFAESESPKSDNGFSAGAALKSLSRIEIECFQPLLIE